MSRRRLPDEQVRRGPVDGTLTLLVSHFFLLPDQLAPALSARRRSCRHGALISLDRDRFRPFHESGGHVLGDRLLAATAKRLKTCLRETATVARLGGNGFVFLPGPLSAPGSDVGSRSGAIAARIRARLSSPMVFESAQRNRPAAMTGRCCSVGIGGIAIEACQIDGAGMVDRADPAIHKIEGENRHPIRLHDEPGAASVGAGSQPPPRQGRRAGRRMAGRCGRQPTGPAPTLRRIGTRAQAPDQAMAATAGSRTRAPP